MTDENPINSRQEEIKTTVETATTTGLDEAHEKDTALGIFINDIDHFQDTLKKDVVEADLQKRLAQEVLGLLKQATSAEDVERLQNDLQQKLETLSASINSYRAWKEGKYKVEKGDDLSKLVEKELGIPWKEDPKAHFAIVHKLQEQRSNNGSLPTFNENSEFTVQKTTDPPDHLNIGEYLDLNAAKANAVPSIEDIRWYTTVQPKYGKPLAKVADELAAEEARMQAGTAEADLADSDIATEEVRPTYLQEMDGAMLSHAQQDDDANAAHLTDDFEDNYSLEAPPAGSGSILYFEKALAAANDGDFWDDPEKEQAILENIRVNCQINLRIFSEVLDQGRPKERETAEYETARQTYLKASMRLVELSASVDEAFENSGARNVEAAMQTANDLLPHMTLTEATRWTFALCEKIDENDFQSEALATDYQKLFSVVKGHLAGKLSEERGQSDYGPYANACLTLAELFSGRSGSIDDNLRDSTWAAELAREAADTGKITAELVNQSSSLLGEQLVLAKVFQEEKAETLTWLRAQNNPAMNKSIEILSSPTGGIEDLAAAEAIMIQVTYLKDGLPSPNESELTEMVQKYMGAFLSGAQGQFEDYLKETAKSPGTMQNELGIHLEPYQVAGLNLLTDIQGYGFWEWSDNSVAMAKVGAKIAACIAAGVAVAVATGGLGLVAGAIAGGAAVTASNAVMSGKGFEDGALGFVDAYGKEMLVNTATMGTARYLAAGRAIYQLRRAGAIETVFVRNGRAVVLSPEAKQVLSLAGQKNGMQAIAGLDEGLGVGGRLTGASLEGLADVSIGSSLDTLFTGGTFTENLQNNAMFFGLGLGFEFGGPAMKRTLQGAEVADDVTLNRVHRVNEEKVQLQQRLLTLCEDNNLNPNELVEILRSGGPLPEVQNPEALQALADDYHRVQSSFKQNVDTLLGLSTAEEDTPTVVGNRAVADPLPEKIPDGPGRLEKIRTSITELTNTIQLWATNLTQAVSTLRPEAIDANLRAFTTRLTYLWSLLPSVPDLGVRATLSRSLGELSFVLTNLPRRVADLSFERRVDQRLITLQNASQMDAATLLEHSNFLREAEGRLQIAELESHPTDIEWIPALSERILAGKRRIAELYKASHAPANQPRMAARIAPAGTMAPRSRLPERAHPRRSRLLGRADEPATLARESNPASQAEATPAYPLDKEFAVLVSKPDQVAGTHNILREPWFKVEHKEVVGGRTFYFGPVTLKSTSNPQSVRLECVAFVEIDGKLYPRIFYKSYSDGGWRASPGMAMDPSGPIFSKGARKHYTQETKPTELIVAYLEKAEANTITVPEAASAHFSGPVYLQNIVQYKSEVVVTQDVLDPSFAYTIGKGGKTEFHMNAMKGFSPEATRMRLENITYPEGFVPNFEQSFVNNYLKNHSILGPSQVYVYEGKLNGRTVEWHMAVDNENRVWIDAIRYQDAAISSFGTYSEVINSGVLTQKPVEYIENIVTVGERGVDYLPLPQNKQNAGYVDQTPLLGHLKPIQEFRTALAALRMRNAA